MEAAGIEPAAERRNPLNYLALRAANLWIRCESEFHAGAAIQQNWRPLELSAIPPLLQLGLAGSGNKESSMSIAPSDLLDH